MAGDEPQDDLPIIVFTQIFREMLNGSWPRKNEIVKYNEAEFKNYLKIVLQHEQQIEDFKAFWKAAPRPFTFLDELSFTVIFDLIAYLKNEVINSQLLMKVNLIFEYMQSLRSLITIKELSEINEELDKEKNKKMTQEELNTFKLKLPEYKARFEKLSSICSCIKGGISEWRLNFGEQGFDDIKTMLESISHINLKIRQAFNLYKVVGFFNIQGTAPDFTNKGNDYSGI